MGKTIPMNTRNTVTTLRFTHLKRLDGALLVLDVLSNPISFQIIDCLSKRSSATQLDLLIHSGAGFDELEELLELLCMAEIIEYRSDLFSSTFQLNEERLGDITETILEFSMA